MVWVIDSSSASVPLALTNELILEVSCCILGFSIFFIDRIFHIGHFLNPGWNGRILPEAGSPATPSIWTEKWKIIESLEKFREAKIVGTSFYQEKCQFLRIFSKIWSLIFLSLSWVQRIHPLSEDAFSWIDQTLIPFCRILTTKI